MDNDIEKTKNQESINYYNWSILEFLESDSSSSFISKKNKKIRNDIYSIIEPRLLEENLINRNLDSFIIHRIHPIEEFLPLRNENTSFISDNLDKDTFHSSTGLSAAVVGPVSGLTIDGKVVSKGSVAQINFRPYGRIHFEPKEITDSLVKGIEGIQELLQAIDQGNFDNVQVLIGNTNINMALIAQRLGFRIVDQCRTADGKIDKSLTNFTVVGTVENVHAKIKEFEARAERLKRRHKRTSSKRVKTAV